MKIVVVGGGISGISSAYLLKKHTNHEVILIEKEKLIGGKAKTIYDNRYLIESGPNGFLNNKIEIRNLIKESNFSKNVIESNDTSKRKFIFSNNKLFEIPENPIKLLFSNFLSLRAKLRLLQEPFIPKFVFDETLEHFVVRRLGLEMLKKLIGPMSIGVYAGDPHIMSMKATFDRIKEIEIQYGSLIGGLIKLMREKKTKTENISGGFSSKLLSFKHGVGSFINYLSCDVKCINDTALSIKKDNNYKVIMRNYSINADAVVFAVPAYDLKYIIKDMDFELYQSLTKLTYAPINVVAMGFDKKFKSEFVNSFGYLFDMDFIEDVIGVLFDSSIFKQRADNNHFLVRIMIGGGIRKESAYKTNPIELALKELQRSAKIFASFEYSKVLKWTNAIPIYSLEHKYILEKIHAFESKNPRIFITGNAFYGVSLNDCVKSSYNILEKIKHI